MGRSRASLLLCVPCLLPLAAWAELNDTGQARCHYAQAMEACRGDAAFPGQDAQYGRDALAREGRLRKQGGGEAGFDFVPLDLRGEAIALDAKGAPVEPHACVRDTVSGLVWRVGMAQTAPLGPEQARAMVDLARREAWCGFADWRLPQVAELISLADFGRATGGIDPVFFPDARKAWYRSGDAFPGAAGLIHVFAYDGDARGSLKSFALPAEQGMWLRLVRGKRSLAILRSRPDGTVLDVSTGLVWDACVFGRRGKRCEKGKALHPDWSEALRRVAKANERRYKGFSDWRLPNVKELFSIVDPARQMPAIAKESFPASEPDWFWSSTTRVAYNGGVHTVDFAVGHARYDNKPEAHFMRLVRGGL